MMVNFRTLNPNDSLKFAASELLAGSQTEFPVMEDSRLVGILQRKNLVEGLRAADGELNVAGSMTVIDDFAEEGEPLDDVIQRMKTDHCSSLPVMRDGSLIGLVTMENIGELVMVNSAVDDNTTVRVPEAQASL